MAKSKLTAQAEEAFYFNKFREGHEKGLEFFYRFWYPKLYYKGLKYIKDDVNADGIVNEAFLRLWLLRPSITAVEQIEQFIKKLTSDAYKAYYKTASHKFQRNMLHLDELDYEFVGGVQEEEDNVIAVLSQYEKDEVVQSQMAQVNAVLPNLKAEQQLFIRLCIRYAFDYGRIAWHIGGISDYEVAHKVEKTLLCLRAILTDTKKLSEVGKANRYTFEGELCEEQGNILQMRYELKYSFEEIAKALGLSQPYVQRRFVQAITRVKKVKV